MNLPTHFISCRILEATVTGLEVLSIRTMANKFYLEFTVPILPCYFYRVLFLLTTYGMAMAFLHLTPSPNFSFFFVPSRNWRFSFMDKSILFREYRAIYVSSLTVTACPFFYFYYRAPWGLSLKAETNSYPFSFFLRVSRLSFHFFCNRKENPSKSNFLVQTHQNVVRFV